MHPHWAQYFAWKPVSPSSGQRKQCKSAIDRQVVENCFHTYKTFHTLLFIICQGQRTHCRHYSTFKSLRCNIFRVIRTNTSSDSWRCSQNWKLRLWQRYRYEIFSKTVAISRLCSDSFHDVLNSWIWLKANMYKSYTIKQNTSQSDKKDVCNFCKDLLYCVQMAGQCGYQRHNKVPSCCSGSGAWCPDVPIW